MATERDDLLQSVRVRLDGKNYSYWSYVMRSFLKDKSMWGYASGTYVKPKNTEEGGGCCFNRYMRSKECKDYYLDQQFC
jgi:hypothetical protein